MTVKVKTKMYVRENLCNGIFPGIPTYILFIENKKGSKVTFDECA